MTHKVKISKGKTTKLEKNRVYSVSMLKESP